MLLIVAHLEKSVMNKNVKVMCCDENLRLYYIHGESYFNSM